MSVEDPALTSPDIAHRERLDDRFAGRTGAQAPLLRVSGVPEDAVELLHFKSLRIHPFDGLAVEHGLAGQVNLVQIK